MADEPENSEWRKGFPIWGFYKKFKNTFLFIFFSNMFLEFILLHSVLFILVKKIFFALK